MILGTGFLVCVILLLPSYVMLALEKNALLDEEMNRGGVIKTESAKDLQATLGDIKVMLDIASPVETKLSEAIVGVMASRGTELVFNTISYTRGVDGPSSLTIEGTASTRAKLLSLSKALEKQDLFDDVSLPIDNLAKESNFNFTLTALGKF